MTLDDLIAEGRALERRCWFLRADERGVLSGLWHADTDDERRRWLTVDTSFYSGIGGRHMSVIADPSGNGSVEFTDRAPEASLDDIRLFATEGSVLPPIEAVFAFGSDRVGSWLTENRWQRDWGYNPNFSGSALVEGYLRAYQAGHPLYSSSDVFAVIGGWHFPFPDGDWCDLVDDELLLMTFQDAEPWLEVWRCKDGSFRVMERIT